jgi:DnaJ-class molecular chaperone
MESFKKFIVEAPDHDAWLMQGAPGENDVNCPACRDGSHLQCGGHGCQECKGTGDCPVCQGAGEVDRLTAQKYAAGQRDDFDRGDDMGPGEPHPRY